ncbi:MAG: HD domain-containing protein [Spirochaetaceae bacterium]|jgi:HD superfamily phosphohydrolase|nr:HD domain-containing protein [Spirochaetaceae bacterium]
MNRRFTTAVRDPIWKHIYLTEPLFEASRSEPFTRLSRIRQLGPTEILYPGATHTRASHSYGVYHVAKRLLEKLVERGAGEWITEEGTCSYLAAALFHDLGHFPYTHSLKELSLNGSPLKEHETLTAECILREPLYSLTGKTGADPRQVAAIIDASVHTDDGETLFFRRLLSGVLDPDKLDYLNRDAFFCGVPYGTQDTDYILSRLIPDRERGVVIDSPAVMSVESILFSKYLMYRSVYWHRQVRIATAMMKKALYSGLSEGVFTQEELYNQDDAGIFSLIQTCRFTGKKVALNLHERRLYHVVYETPFNGAESGVFRSAESAAQRQLENLDTRSIHEAELAELFSRAMGTELDKTDILIDIPEEISFESDLWVTDEKKTFSRSSTIFREDIIEQFTRSLRILRIAVSPDIGSKIDHRKLAEICNMRYTIR